MHWNDLPGLIDQINQIKTTDILYYTVAKIIDEVILYLIQIEAASRV